MAILWRCAMGIAVVGVCLGLAACSDHDTLPTEAATYTGSMSVTWSGPPFPQTGEVVVVAERTTSAGSGPVSDGVVVTLTTDRWAFDNGLQRVGVSTVDGRASAQLVADGPGTARVSASFEIGGQQVGMATSFTLEGDG